VGFDDTENTFSLARSHSDPITITRCLVPEGNPARYVSVEVSVHM